MILPPGKTRGEAAGWGIYNSVRVYLGVEGALHMVCGIGVLGESWPCPTCPHVDANGWGIHTERKGREGGRKGGQDRAIHGKGG